MKFQVRFTKDSGQTDLGVEKFNTRQEAEASAQDWVNEYNKALSGLSSETARAEFVHAVSIRSIDIIEVAS